MNEQQEIREGMKEILRQDLIDCNITHENAPPYKDCGEECGVSLEDQIAASNPVCSPVRSGGIKHRKCMDCWNEYISDLIFRLIRKQGSQGVVLKVKCPDCTFSQFKDEVVGMTPCHSCNSTGYVYEPLEVKDNEISSCKNNREPL